MYTTVMAVATKKTTDHFHAQTVSLLYIMLLIMIFINYFATNILLLIENAVKNINVVNMEILAHTIIIFLTVFGKI